MADLDPLSTYDYPYNYEQMQAHHALYPYNVKLEPPHHLGVISRIANSLNPPDASDNQNVANKYLMPTTDNQNDSKYTSDTIGNQNDENKFETNNHNYEYELTVETKMDIKRQIIQENPDCRKYVDNEDTKEDIKPIIERKQVKRSRKKTGKTSSYWNKKVSDSSFKFYGCTICEISFATIQELDQHVTIHKGRLTSYDLRLKNQLKKKQMKKEQKKLKKLQKVIKRENITPDIEIKPEDGYIGYERASEFFPNGGFDALNLINPENGLINNENNAINNQTSIENNENGSHDNELASKGSGSGDHSNVTTAVIASNGNGSDKQDEENSANDKGSSNQDNEIAANGSSSGNQDDEIAANGSGSGNQDNIAANGNKSNQDVETVGNGSGSGNHDSDIAANGSGNQDNDFAANGNGNQDNDIAASGSGKQDNDKAASGQGSGNQDNETAANGNKSEQNVEPTDPRLEKLFKCFACQKQFMLSYYLKLHVRSHTDEKPYTCAECGQSFITASKLGRHNKRIHLAIRFQCRICYRFFSRFEYLTRHFDKKHPDDKLEGEPYDYNAILPYLKELEDQLRQKSEETKEEKPNPEDLWSNWTPMDQLHQTFVDRTVHPDQNQQTDMGDGVTYDSTSLEITIEEVKVEETEMKKEKEEVAEYEEVREDSVKDESLSDDDYFPSNTWASTPKIDTTPTSPLPRRKRHKPSDYPLKCEICEKTINSASYMKVHLRTHTGERPFKCYICNRGFITSSKMHRHVLTHSETWGDGENKVKLEGDIKMEVDPEGDTSENKGESVKKGKAIFGKKMLKDGGRKKRNYQRRAFSCCFCQKRFLHQETMLVHKKSHEGEELVLKCTYCLEVAPDAESLKLHEAGHSGPRPYLCTVCGRKYAKRESMIYHRKNHQPGQCKEWVCDICSKTFNAQCKLQRHIVSHRVDKYVLRYECPVCAHMFNTKYHVQMHLATHQKEGLIMEESRGDILAMVLQNARKIPKKQEAPVGLIDIIPPDERSRVCNICGQVFQHFYYLEEHLKSHGSKIAIEDDAKVEEKKHICEICNKGFKLHYYLKLHSFTHTKEKPFICQQCGKGFITKGKLKRHLETHSGLKKYQCHICYKFFTRPSYLRIHVRTIHGTQDYNFVNKQYDDIPDDGQSV